MVLVGTCWLSFIVLLSVWLPLPLLSTSSLPTPLLLSPSGELATHSVNVQKKNEKQVIGERVRMKMKVKIRSGVIYPNRLKGG